MEDLGGDDDEFGSDDDDPDPAGYAKFNPNHDELGRFTFGSGGTGDDSSNDQNGNLLPQATPLSESVNTINDPPIHPVYPIEDAIVMLFGGEAFSTARSAVATVETTEEATIAEAGLTEHATERVSERAISSEEAQKAIQTAKDTNNVTTQIGKYGTLQNVYKGTNGVQ